MLAYVIKSHVNAFEIDSRPQDIYHFGSLIVYNLLHTHQLNVQSILCSAILFYSTLLTQFNNPWQLGNVPASDKCFPLPPPLGKISPWAEGHFVAKAVFKWACCNLTPPPKLGVSASLFSHNLLVSKYFLESYVATLC